MDEETDKKSLTSRQLSAIAHLVASPSIEEACRRAKVSKPTVYAWLKDESFKAELERQRDNIYGEALERIKGGANKAVERLIKLVGSKREEIALRASNDLISYAFKLKESDKRERNLEETSPFSAKTIREVWEEEMGNVSEKNGESSL